MIAPVPAPTTAPSGAFVFFSACAAQITWNEHGNIGIAEISSLQRINRTLDAVPCCIDAKYRLCHGSFILQRLQKITPAYGESRGKRQSLLVKLENCKFSKMCDYPQ
jgi:hypothetical protein